MNYLANDEETDKTMVGDIIITFRKNDGGGAHYRGKTHFEEYLSSFYRLLRSAVNPAFCIDVGANYGYTGMLMGRSFPESRVILVEPIPWIESYIRYNFNNNNMRFDALYSAICSESSPSATSTFGVRDRGTQDSRVVPHAGMRQIETSVVTLDQLTTEIAPDEGVYVKVDTQGWEEHVFSGGASFLERHDRWFIKAEFAPAWLESQGTDPADLLQQLLRRYEVYEAAGRVRWNCGSLAELVGRPLRHGEEKAFTHHVRHLGPNDTGWVDIYVMPPASRRSYDV